jgi:hypothetical protein
VFGSDFAWKNRKIIELMKHLKLTMNLKGYTMAHNFKIFMHRTIDNLHLNLKGDFDGSSAFELLNILKENLNSTKRILIDTNNLKKIYPFGREVFDYNLSKLMNHRIRIQFIGPNTLRSAPT